MDDQKTQVIIDSRYYTLICTMNCRDSKDNIIAASLYKDIIGYLVVFNAQSYTRFIQMEKMPSIDEIVNYAKKEI